ncbi:MAG: polyprenyl diphosphate synthase [Patescibacteria group bacterium]
MEDMQKHLVGHVAIIPDGNRRWAKARGKMPWMGHAEGAKTFEKILKSAFEQNVYCLSFWGMSVDNIDKRPPREVKFLLDTFSKVLMKAAKSPNLEKYDVRVSILGEWRERFPKKLVTLGEKIIEETKNRKKHVVNLLLCYDGKTEMISAFKKAGVSKGNFTTPKDFLWTRDLPPVDLVIRTGGDPHLSAGFMMWDTADAQLRFEEKMWPDFTVADFEEAIADFKKRERRFGA